MSGLPASFRAAVVRRRDALQVLDASGSATQASSIRGALRWPAWVPRSGGLVVSRHPGGRETTTGSVVLLTPETGEETPLYVNASGDPPVIAPRVPHYVLPAPRGDRTAIVAATSGGLALFVRDLDGGNAQEPALITGAPLFPAWSPDGRYLAIHSASSFTVLDTGSGERFEIASENALGFRTPAYSDDGELLASAVYSPGAVDVVFSTPDGTGRKGSVRFDRGVAFAFRPRTQELTVATALDPNGGIYESLWQVDTGSNGERRRIFHGPFTAFEWSPAGDRIAVVYATQSGDGAYAIYMLDTSGSVAAASSPFHPSDDQATWLTFFDQYATSHSLWTPGGEGFLVCGRAGTDRFAPSFGDARGASTYLWDGARGAPFADLGPGEFAVPG